MNEIKPKLIIQENLIKNLLVIICIILFYPSIKEGILGVPIGSITSLLSIISILIMTACFANFAFSYGKIKIHLNSTRYLAHGATFLFMLIVAFLLESLSIAIGIAYPSIYIIALVFSVLLYISIIFFDFLDLFRAW